MAHRQSSWMQRSLSFLKEVWARYNADNASLAAAAIAFYLLLSLFPLLLLLIAAIAYFFTPAEAAAQIEMLTANLGPTVGAALQQQVISIVLHREVLTGIALIGGLWSGRLVFLSITQALNGIWKARRARPFWVNHGLALLMTIILGALIGLALLLSALAQLLWTFFFPEESSWIVTMLWRFLITILAPTVLVAIVLMIVYRLLPTRKMPWKPIIVVSLITAVFWEMALQLFTLYTTNFGNYSYLYGSLGGLVLLMLWLDYSAIITLLGAEIIGVWVSRRKQPP
ncbi:MAG: YihY/virulence factor BrkB family protein [Armatimonadota bacterium]